MDRSIRRFGLDRASSSRRYRGWFLGLAMGVAATLSIAPVQAQEMCGGQNYPFPYTDVSGVGAAFCPGIMEAYVTGVSKGTTPTTFSPDTTVTRVQMTTFLQRSLDQGLARASRRAALNQWWTTQLVIPVGILVDSPQFCATDGESIWTTTFGEVAQVQPNGLVAETWTGATNSEGVVDALGQIFATGKTSPGSLYYVNPQEPGGAVEVTAAVLGNNPIGIAFDGVNLWTANYGPPGSVSIISTALFSNVTTVSTGFTNPYGILYDGAHTWVTDQSAGKLFKLDASGTILQTVTVGAGPGLPVFDGANIWVPNQSDSSITVVQASTGNVVATISSDPSNQLNGPNAASFDGERVLVTNGTGASVTVFKAADLSLITNVATQANAIAACSDGTTFWIPDQAGYLFRF